jgi:hypothetical protein
MAVLVDGTGPALTIGGDFGSVYNGMNSVVALGIARWDGSSWTPLGSGFTTAGGGGATSLIGFDDGSGPAIFAGGACVAPDSGDGPLAKFHCIPPTIAGKVRRR